MKNILFAVIGFITFSCTNPSMEEGLARLTETLAQLEAEIVAANIEGMQADLAEITAQAEQALLDAEESNQIVEDALVTIASIKERLAALQVILDEAATAEQVAALRDKVAQISEGISMLVAVADYDYDGVMNAFDQCPETPLEDIDSVNTAGCAPDQTPITGTSTTTTGG